jgi:hypothetical protein
MPSHYLRLCLPSAIRDSGFPTKILFAFLIITPTISLPLISLSQYCSFLLMTLPAHSGSSPLIQFRNNFSQTVGLLGRVSNPSQGRYLNTGQQKHRKNAHTPNIRALSGIRTHDPSVRASEDSSCFSPRGYCDRSQYYSVGAKFMKHAEYLQKE